MAYRKLIPAITAILTLAAAAHSSAATTVGSIAPNPSVVEPCNTSLTITQFAVANGPSYVIPSDGVITSWSAMGPAAAPVGPLTLKILRGLGGNQYTVMGSSSSGTPTPAVSSTFPTRIPVKAGQRLALSSPSATSPCIYDTTLLGDGYVYNVGPERSTGSTFTTDQEGVSSRTNVSAQLEPDADGDGFGDESQDGCPTVASTQSCPPPETTITKAPKKLKVKGKRKAVATFVFASDASGSSFVCSVDGGAPLACASPYTTRVKKGEHTFTVTATSSFGIAETTGASTTFKVEKKRKKRRSS